VEDEGVFHGIEALVVCSSTRGIEGGSQRGRGGQQLGRGGRYPPILRPEEFRLLNLPMKHCTIHSIIYERELMVIVTYGTDLLLRRSRRNLLLLLKERIVRPFEKFEGVTN